MSVIQAYHILVKENKPKTVGPTATNLPGVNTEKMRPSVYTFLKGIKIKTELSDFKILVTVGPGPIYTRNENYFRTESPLYISIQVEDPMFLELKDV